MYGQLFRQRYGRKVGGVCAGLARAYGWDVTTVRLATVLLIVFTGVSIFAYIVCWVVIPEEPVALPPYAAEYPPPPPSAGYPPSGPPTA